ncbi:hypothetical protein VSU19_09575 [Verrucomicrobiales bacterium BCK34]|nr:hypothetical protein [Verrucomicrobiales bacterium BCK34]
MGVLYTVTPPTEEVAEWLGDLGVGMPRNSSSRLPLLHEVRTALDSLDGFSVEYTDNGIGSHWQAMVTSVDDPDTGGWTLLNITNRKDDSEPQEIWFEKGFPELIVEILTQISSSCGTLILIPDTGCRPLVIPPRSDPRLLCAQWEHLEPTNG